MGKFLSPRMRSVVPSLAFLVTGFLIGASWVMHLDEEQQQRIKKNLFELREMPFRIYI